MKTLVLINGYIWIIGLPFTILRYLSTGSASTKWGTFYGSNARDAVIGYSLLTILFGWLSLCETLKILKDRKRKNEK